jgi:hypothetical protein
MTELDIQEAGPLKLPLAEIKIDPDLQCRADAALSKRTAREYAEVMREHGPDVFPSVIIFRDSKGQNWLADGFTRCEALKSIDETASIKVEIHEGSRKDALLYAAGANAEHGRARTPADKRKAVLALLAEPQWAKRADNWIAKHAKVSHTFVAKLRSTCNDSSEPRETADGRVMDTSKIGRAAAPALDLDRLVAKFRKLLGEVPGEMRAAFSDQVVTALAEEQRGAA